MSHSPLVAVHPPFVFLTVTPTNGTIRSQGFEPSRGDSLTTLPFPSAEHRLKMVESLNAVMREETTESLNAMGAGVQQTHMQLAVTRRYWRCVFLLERALDIPKDKSGIPDHFYQPPEGWAVGMTAAEPGQRPDMPMKPFYWKAFEKGQCYDEPPEGSKKLVHQGDGTFL